MRKAISFTLPRQLSEIVSFYRSDRLQLAKIAELELLKTIKEININGSNEGEIKGKIFDLDIGNKNYIHTLQLQKSIPATKSPVVLTHGYGVGLGMYFPNLGPVASSLPNHIYALDWLGMGLSSRPKFTKKLNIKLPLDERIKESEIFFIDGLEKWRVGMGLDKITLVGHSLGGYLSSVYALKYPERVDRLVLISPVGIPKSPYQHPPTRNAPKLINLLWDNHVTPQAFVRTLGPYGHSLVQRYTQSRFTTLTPITESLLTNYIHQIATLPGSGEYALGTILSFAAYARHPLIDRLHELKVPVEFIYGDKDWMNPNHAVELQKKLKVENKLHIVPAAGHQTFLDNPIYFNKLLIDILKKTN